MADRRRKRLTDRGAAAVEMAMMMLFLFLLIAGIFDLGRALYTLIGLQEAAQEGAIYGSFEPTGDIQERVKSSITFPQLEDENVTVTCPGPSPTGRELIEVTVDYDVDLTAPIISQWLGGTINLTRTFTGEVFLGTCIST